MKNTIKDLNNYLFETIERLTDDDLSEEEFKKEIERSKAISSVANKIILSGKLMLDAQKYQDEYGNNSATNMLGLKNE